ncbi:MAG: HEPN domain-containing protein, partial [Zetaproteobacteria bacterium]|nr:HEPN domain-containing protein [Zetaproteobacteria bacterium]
CGPNGRVSRSFSIAAFPLLFARSYVEKEPQLHDNFLIQENQIKNILEWFDIIFNCSHKQYIKVPLERIQTAIFEQKNPNSAIIDGFIAWEGMFSSQSNITQSVCHSIHKLTTTNAEQQDKEQKPQRLKKLYHLRSTLVHGSSPQKILKTLANDRNTYCIEDAYQEVIKVALECLKKLLQDKDLLELSPEERCNKLKV